MLAAFAMTALCLGPPVEVDVEALALPEQALQQLHGQLLTRLVEAGETVGHPGVVTLRMAGGDGIVRVEVQHGRHIVAQTVAGEGAVLRLAAIHAAIDLLSELAQSEHAADPALGPELERAVVIDAGPGTEPELPAAIVAAVAAGAVVTSQDAGAGRRLCLGIGSDGGLRIGVAPVDEPCHADRSFDALGTGIATALAGAPLIVQTEPEPLTGSEHRSEHPTQAAAVPSDSGSATEQPTLPGLSEPTPQRTKARWMGAVGAGAGAQGRLRSAEPLLLIDASARHDRGLVLPIRAALAPSSGRSVRAYDTFMTVGAGWRIGLSARVGVQAAATAGLSIHAFTVGRDRGSRTDFTVEVPLALDIRVARRLELTFGPHAGWTSRSRNHTANGETLWSRDSWRVGATVGLRFLLPAPGNSDQT